MFYALVGVRVKSNFKRQALHQQTVLVSFTIVDIIAKLLATGFYNSLPY
jgi:hypothetical protein